MRKKSLQRTLVAMMASSMILTSVQPAFANTTSAQEQSSEQKDSSSEDDSEEMETGNPQNDTLNQDEQEEKDEGDSEESSSVGAVTKQEDESKPDDEKTESSGDVENSKKESTDSETKDETKDLPTADDESTDASEEESSAEEETESPEESELSKVPADSDADEVIYNLGEKEITVSDAEDADEKFEADGSYTIELSEKNPYFPYEVQFKYDDTVQEEWFMTPYDTVTIDGHDFSVSIANQADEGAYTSYTLEIAGDEIPIYPEEKTFTNRNALVRMLFASRRVVTRTYEKQTLSTVDLSKYTPVELTQVKLKSIFDSNGVDTSDNSIMWTMDSDKKLQYEVNSADDYIDLSVETASNKINNWKMLVKKNDQLAEEGIEYTVPIKTKISRYWLKGLGTVTDANGNKTNQTAEGDQNRYYDYVKVGRTFRTRINIDRSIRSQDVQFGFTVNKDEFPDFDGEIQVYEGKHKTESELSKAKNITADILNGTYKGRGRHDTTIVSVKNGSITGILPLNVIFQTEGEYLQESWDLVDEDGNIVSDNYETVTSDSGPGMTIIYKLAEGKPANGQYCASFEYVKNGTPDNTLVTDAFLGNFKTIKDAKNAGAKSIKDELFSDSGYKADYSAGVDVTIFVGDDSEYRLVYHRTILTQAYTEEPSQKNNDTFVQFTGLMTKDASGNLVKVPCYFLDEYADSYGEYNFPTLMVAGDVDLSNVAPTFELDPTVTLYAKGQKQPEKSGESFHDLTSGMLQYTAAAEDEESQRNYWLQVVKITDQKDKLFINSFTDPDAKTSDKDGVIYSTREVMLDDYHDDLHDIVLFNQGNADINNISAELESDTLELDDYWTLKGNSSLKDYEESEGANKDKSDLSDLAVNMADIRLKAKDDAEDGTDVSGKLTIKSGDKTLVVLTLTGTIGDPTIITKDIPDAVKYVPYGTMIQNSNKYSWNHPTYSLYDGELPKGMTIRKNGELYGVPQETGTFTFEVMMENDFSSRNYREHSFDSESREQIREFTINVLDNTDANVENATEEGYELRPDTANDLYNGRVPDFRMTEADNEYTLVSNGTYAEFKYIFLDGELLVDGKDYTSNEGSTRITLKSETLKKNGKGTHTLGIEFRSKKNLNTKVTSGNKRTSAEGTLKRAAQNYHIDEKGTSNTNSSSHHSSSSGGSSSSTQQVVMGPANTPRVLTNGTWVKNDDGSWMFVGTDGKPVIGWKYLNTLTGAHWFYFDNDGKMLTGWLVTEDGKWHFLNPNGESAGAMAEGLIVDPQDNHLYLLDLNTGDLLVGWYQLNGKYYYFNAVPGKIGTSGWSFDSLTNLWSYKYAPTFAYGAMLQNTQTPDGYFVGSDGVWVEGKTN